MFVAVVQVLSHVWLLWPHGLQHSRLLCPPLSPGICSYPFSRWCYLTISSSAVPSPLAFSLSQHQGLFQWVSSLHYMAKVWLQHLSNEYSGLIFFRIDWFDLLAVQGTLKILFQHHSLKVSILWSSAFFMVQLSYPHMTTGKTIALNMWQNDISAFLHSLGFS